MSWTRVSVAASQSTEVTDSGRRRRAGWSLPGVRLAAIGALVVFASLVLPWYGVSLQLFQVITESGLSSFGAGALALVLTAAAALYLAVITARGYRLPRPLTGGGLMVAAGVWCAVLAALLTVETPAEILGIDTVETEFGPFVALGGAVAICIGGLRMRRAAQK
jgi:hypothetical protein